MDKTVAELTRKYVGRQVNKKFSTGFFNGEVVGVYRHRRYVYAQVTYLNGHMEDILVRNLPRFLQPVVNRAKNGFKIVPSANPVKSRINDRVAEAAAASPVKGKIVFLDTPLFNTFSAVKSKNIPQDRMITPEYDVSVYHDMKHESHVVHGTLYSVIDQSPANSLSLVWADYESTWFGNKLVSPKSDMQKLVEKRCVVKGGTVFITLSKRGTTRRVAMESVIDVWYTMRGFVLKSRVVYKSMLVLELTREL